MPVFIPSPTETVAVMEHLSTIPLTATKIKQQTDRDPILSKVKCFTQSGWPETLDAHAGCRFLSLSTTGETSYV